MIVQPVVWSLYRLTYQHKHVIYTVHPLATICTLDTSNNSRDVSTSLFISGRSTWEVYIKLLLHAYRLSLRTLQTYFQNISMSTNQNIESFAITIWARCMDLLRSRCLESNFVLTGNFRHTRLIKMVWGSEITWAVLLMNSSSLLTEEPRQQSCPSTRTENPALYRRRTLPTQSARWETESHENVWRPSVRACVRACVPRDDFESCALLILRSG
jgi:hypothetical protein